MKRTIEFEDAGLDPAIIQGAERLLGSMASIATERAGFIVEQVDAPVDIAGQITRAMTSYNDASTLMQNSIATIVQLGHRLMEDAEQRAEPTIDEGLEYACKALRRLGDMLPPEGYAHAAELLIALTDYRRYLEVNDIGRERGHDERDQAAGGGDAAAGAGPAAQRGPSAEPGAGDVDRGGSGQGGEPPYLRGSRG